MGGARIHGNPTSAMLMNHTTITGPNKAPTVRVPRDWIMKSAIRITIVTATTYRFEDVGGDRETLDSAQH